MRKQSRPLRYESLESRTLFSVDGMIPHNFMMPEDCDNSGDVSPLDALMVINELNRGDSKSAAESQKMLDVDADGFLSPLDALVVINHMNRRSVDGTPVVSSISNEARMARLQLAVANSQLPKTMSLEVANELIDTLRAGGKPELGERFIEGRLHPKIDVDRIDNERAVLDLDLPGSTQDNESESSRLSRFVENLAVRFKAAGVNEQVITTITTEIVAGIEANKPLTLTQIKGRLTELGVDVSKLFPGHTENPGHKPVDRIERQLNEWFSRFKSAGVSVEIITTVVGEIRTGIESGTPLTLTQIKDRLVALGVDLSKIFPPRIIPDGSRTLPVELVTRILAGARVPRESIEVVRKALIAAKELGKPLSVRDFVTLLQSENIQIPDAMRRLLGIFR